MTIFHCYILRVSGLKLSLDAKVAFMLGDM